VLRRRLWPVWGAALVLGVGAGATIALARSSHGAPVATAPPVSDVPDAAWAAGAKRAPDFALVDQAGAPVSVGRFRGRPVIVTFIDPLCRNLCPTEAKVLQSVEARLPASMRPAIVAVSVDQWGNARRYLLEDVAKWKLSRGWYWAVGKVEALRRVWRAYKIGVQDRPKTVANVTVHYISHTEAAYLIDPNGDQRALFLYPFRAAAVARTVRQLAGAPG
jgi:cytochrome oxidase Cu insertion factor (SCO1/SenC/PrrC family)